MKRSITVPLLSVVMIALLLPVERTRAQSSDGAALPVDDGGSPAVVKIMPDGVYWGLLLDVDVQHSVLSFVPLCTGLLTADFDKLGRDEQIPRLLPITSATELWYFAIPTDGNVDLAYYGRTKDVKEFSDIASLKTGAPWSLRLREGVVEWIQEDGLRLGAAACERLFIPETTIAHDPPAGRATLEDGRKAASSTVAGYGPEPRTAGAIWV